MRHSKGRVTLADTPAMDSRSITSRVGDPKERAEQLRRLHDTQWVRDAIRDGRGPGLRPHFEAIVRRETWVRWLRGAFSMATAAAIAMAVFEALA